MEGSQVRRRELHRAVRLLLPQPALPFAQHAEVGPLQLILVRRSLYAARLGTDGVAKITHIFSRVADCASRERRSAGGLPIYLKRNEHHRDAEIVERLAGPC